MLTSNDNDTKDEEVIETSPVDLTKVHEQAVEQLESNPPEEEDVEDESEEDVEDKPEDKEDKEDDSDEEDDDSDEDESEEDVEDKPITPPPAPDNPIELDTDTTKDGNGKIAVKDYDGETHYFNNLDEVPDDFEPASYKEWGTAVAKFTRKEESDRRAKAEQQQREAQAEQQKEIDDVTKRWTSEQEAMRKSGDLPKDDQDYETEVAETLIYIGKQLDKGNIIESFEAAHKARMYDEGKAKKAEKAKKIDRIRRERGSKVLGGSGGQADKKAKGDPLPPGTSLDAVHARYSGLV